MSSSVRDLLPHLLVLGEPHPDSAETFRHSQTGGHLQKVSPRCDWCANCHFHPLSLYFISPLNQFCSARDFSITKSQGKHFEYFAADCAWLYQTCSLRNCCWSFFPVPQLETNPALVLCQSPKPRGERDPLCHRAGLVRQACSLKMFILLKINWHCIPYPPHISRYEIRMSEDRFGFSYNTCITYLFVFTWGKKDPHFSCTCVLPKSVCL